MNNLSPGDPSQIGRYQVIGRLGRGGMGTVYLGLDDTGQRVAIKVINPEYSRHDLFRDRFRREAEAARRVRRFCTAAVLDADLDGDQLYVVTEYVDGPDLEHAVRTGGPLRGSSLDALAVGVATALTAIHGAGIVHRDLKPSNVLLSPVGPRVIDFGIARAMDTLSALTGTGQLVGTPRYMAPETLRGEPVSPACDVFSWGCLVAFAATGRPPFTAEALPAIVYQILNADPVLSGLDPSLHALITATLAKDPSRRPTSQQILDQLIGRTTPENAHHSVTEAWQHSSPPPYPAPSGNTTPAYTGRPGTTPHPPGTTPPPYAGPPEAAAPRYAGSTGHTGTTHHSAGPPPTAPYSGPYAGHPTAPHPGDPAQGHPGYGPTAAHHNPAATASLHPGPTAHGGGPALAGGRSGGSRRTRLIGIAAAAVVLAVVAGFGVRALLAPSGPPTDLAYLYRDDFNQSGTGWGGSTYTGVDYSTYGYAPDGYYAIDVDGGHPERAEKAPIPYLPKQPASPDPSATPTPTTPDRLLISVTAGTRRARADGEYGLFCRADQEYHLSRYEFLVDGRGQARIRRVTKGAGGNLTPPVAVKNLSSPSLLQAECAATTEGLRLTMWINGQELHSYTDPSPLPNGDVGVLARVPPDKAGPALKTSFDDFTVQGPAATSTP
ncbi:serine/threonine-protein kinase [Sphaerisporangium rubeum]|uniref:non-specific serine/threonine protein kinase n=1 Tax=Sphaerisporangium rubeum TaxID=321317 RepID=A0A7X0M801_9ACTN|nr:serine/threonine protein kinase [Sphaerisporangium rubeum]